MREMTMRRIALTTLFAMLAPITILVPPAAAQTSAPAGNVLEQSSEYRFQLDLHVNDAALAKMLPAGWVTNAAVQGAAKDANLRLILVDAQNIVGPDNKVLGKGANRIAMLAAPVKSGSDTGQMILGGISEDSAVPDAYGVFLTATSVKMSRGTSDANGVVTCIDDWDFEAAGGEHFVLHLKYVRGPANKGGGATKFYNPTNPSQYQISTTEQTTDITRNVTTNPPDRVLEFSLKAGGGKYAALFDGSEKPLSWDSQPTFVRVVSSN
jgi:hypothetical protein